MYEVTDVSDITGLIRGAAELEVTPRGVRPHRLPARVRERFPDGQLLAMESQPSGVRIVFRTTASTVTLVTHPTRIAYLGADRPRGRVDVYADGELIVSDELDGGDRMEVDLATGSTAFHPGEPHTTTVTGLPAGRRRFEIWLPHNESVEVVDLRADAPIEPDDVTRPLWVHHGSSISQGSNAVAPSGIWPAVASRRAGAELRNLGFGGSAMVDPFVARVIRDAPADRFPQVERFLQMKRDDAYNSPAWVADHVLALAFGGTDADDVVVRVPDEPRPA